MAKRDVWSSRATFVLAAIGSAIGLGNLWRFPYVCYENGGGAFLFAYILCLFIAGIPLLMLEFSIGKRMNNAAPGAFFSIGKNLQWFGWFAVGVGFVIVTYYSGIMSYCINYLVYSFNLSWGNNPNDYFFNNVLGITDEPWAIGKFQPHLFLGLAVAWIWMVASVWRGTKTVGKVIWVTVLGPWLLLIVFVIRGVTLEGAMDGLRFYLMPQWSKLFVPKVWLAAISQVFYSMTVGFGVMIAYGSFIDDKTCIVSNAWITGLADAGTAIVGGFAVFGALGHKAFTDGVAVTDVVRSGPGLTFVTYPEIINGLPFSQLFGVLFFLMLSFLAVTSAFSLVESLNAALRDKFGWSHRKTNFIVGGTGFALGIPYIFGAGLHWLDIVDHFMNSFGLTVVVIGQCIIVGWIFKAKNMRAFINSHSKRKIGAFWDVSVKFIIPIMILIMLGFEVLSRIQGPYGEFGLRSQEILLGWVVVAIIVTVSIIIAQTKGTPQFESLAASVRNKVRLGGND